MRMGIDDREAAERMRPGAISAQGFLGTDGRALADIIEADEQAARALGLDWDEAADALERLARSGEAGLGEAVEIEGTYLVRSDESRGKLPCPWRDGLFHKNAVSVENLDSGQKVAYSELSIHLLRKHHFCQGEGSPFRLDPAALGRLLGR